jgi:stage V sporulation protein K
MSIIAPVFSVCALGDSWLWAAWQSPQEANAFLEKSTKVISLDCYFYAEAPSQEAAIQTARKLLGPFAKQVGSKLAEEVGKAIYGNLYPDIVKSKVSTGQTSAEFF